MRVEVLPSRDELYDRFAEVLDRGLRSAIDHRGLASLALSRGGEAFHALAARGMTWADVHIFQVDERVAPAGGADRNLTVIERDLVGRIDGPRPVVHPMPVEGDLDEGAATYGAELEAVCDRPPVLDVVHLGLGTDGHTASLLPGDPVLDAKKPVAVTGPHEGYRRMTLTFPVLEVARLLVFAVHGEAKAEIVEELLHGDRDVPARRVRGRDLVVLLDSAAASRSESGI